MNNCSDTLTKIRTDVKFEVESYSDMWVLLAVWAGFILVIIVIRLKSRSANQYAVQVDY